MHLIKGQSNKVVIMQKDKIKIIKKTLKLLENNTWDKISLKVILKDKDNKLFKDKNDVLININKFFDYELKLNLKNLETSSSKDMLFEVIMARLDIINNYRKSVNNLIKFFFSKPHIFIRLVPNFVETSILIATLSNINVAGVKGVPKVKIILLLYFLIIYTWSKDETISLEKTMTTLDKYLNNIDKLLKII